MDRPTALGTLKKRRGAAPAAPSTNKDRVSDYQELSKIKRGLPKRLIAEFEKRKVTSVEEAAKVAQALRAKRVKSHKTAPAKSVSKTPKRKKPAKAEELARPGGKSARKAIVAMKQALNSGIVKL